MNLPTVFRSTPLKVIAAVGAVVLFSQACQKSGLTAASSGPTNSNFGASPTPDPVASATSIPTPLPTPLPSICSSLPAKVPQGVYTLKSAITYVTHSGTPELLDLYLPKNVGPATPMIVYVHGGGFDAGSRTDASGSAKVFASFGMAVASIDYRLVTNGQNLFPDAVQDARCAVRWVKANAAKYGYSATAIGAYGDSASGEIVGLLGTASQVAGDFDSADCGSILNAISPSVLAVSSYYGNISPADPNAVSPTQLMNLTAYLGVAPQDDLPLAEHASPVNYVSSTSTPFYLVRGTADTISTDQAQLDMQTALTAQNVYVSYTDISGLPHGFGPFDISTYPVLETTGCGMIDFFHNYLR